MTSTLRSLVLVAACATLFACQNEKAQRQGGAASAGGQDGSQVVATYAGKSLTLAQLDEKIADQLYQARRQALEQVVMEDLVKMEAEKRGLSEEELLKQEIEAKVPPPSEEQIQQFWEQVKSQVPPGSTLDQFRDRIVRQLSGPQAQERARAYFAELKKTANVEIKLDQPLPPKKDVEAKGPSKGPEDAPVTIVEFSDFQCPFCGRAAGTVDEVMDAYAGKVRLVFRHFPLDFHQQAPKAAEAAMCAHDQGKFWEYHDLLFKHQDALGVEDLKKHAAAAGLDAAKFNECLDSGKHAELVKTDIAAGKAVGVSGTPAFFINGRMLSGAQPLEEFKRVIDRELNAKK